MSSINELEEKQKLLAIALEVNNKSEKEFEEELQL